MAGIIPTAVTGLQSAQTRLAVSANNTANLRSTLTRDNGELVNKPYEPQRTLNTSLEPGGTRTFTQPISEPSVPVYDPELDQIHQNLFNNAGANGIEAQQVEAPDGIVDHPNVDVANEVVEQKLASHAFKANLKTVSAGIEMQDALLEIDEKA